MTHAIQDFVRTIQEDGSFHRIHVRLPRTAPLVAQYVATQIKTTKHNAAAFACDYLGNTTVLWSNGRIQQLIGDEANHLYR